MQINKNVHAIKIPFYVTTPSGTVIERFVYVYMIYGSNGICLIDTGVASAVETIFDYIRQTDRKVMDISLIIQTHTHPDHIGASRTIKGETACNVAVHPAEKAWIEDVQLQSRERPVPDFDTLVAGSLKVNRIVEDGEVLGLGCGLKLKVFYTPGHSKGSISILLLGYMTLFTGDAIPVPGGMPVYEDVIESVASIRKLKEIRGINHLCASWDEPRKGDEAYRKMDEGLLYLQQIHEAVRACAEENPGAGPMQLCPCVLQKIGIPPEISNPIVARSIEAHLKVRDRRSII